MAKYIELDALVDEIEKRKSQNEEWKNSCKGVDALAASMVIQEDINILSLIDTQEVKEVDLDKELSTYLEAVKATDEDIDFVDFAKHFFELGMSVSNKTQKGE